MKDKISEKIKQNVESSHAIDLQKRIIENNEKQKKDLSDEIQRQKDHISKLENQIQNGMIQMSEMSVNIASEQKDTIRKLNESLADTNMKLKKSEKALKAVTKKMISQQEELDKIKLENNANKANIKKLLEEISEKDAKLDMNEATITAHGEIDKNNNSMIDELRKDNLILNQKLEDIQNIKENEKKQLQAAFNNNLGKLQTQHAKEIEAANSQILDLQSKVTEYETIIEDTEQKMNTDSQSLKKLIDDKAKLEQELHNTLVSLKQTEDSLNVSSNKLNLAQEKIKEITEQNTDLQAKLELSDDSLLKKSEEFDKLAADFDDLQNSYNQIDEELKETSDKLSETSNKLKETEETLKEKEQIISSHENSFGECTSKIQELESLTKNAQEDNNRLLKELKDTQDKFNNSETEKQSYIQKLDQTNTELAATKDELVNLTTENENTKSELEKSQKANESYQQEILSLIHI